jgi:predicted Zn-ribbon and HTH transcriptional regulator
MVEQRLATKEPRKDVPKGQRHCPECRSGFVRRSRRHGLWERLLSAVLVYPFRCEDCNYRFKSPWLRGSRRAGTGYGWE